MPEKKENDSPERLLLFINALLDKKALNPVVLNVKEISAFADWFIICSGTSDRQVRAISSAIQESVKKAGLLPLGVEGESEGKWMLLDYDDIIVHVFLESIRIFYDLERLWAEAPLMAIPEDATALRSLPKAI
ncbi:MAG: ribosome silencing factor [Syntrophales bacterium]|nr:ribosome silencing factor [Syntrophales bacterium]